jgi:hypothetical protein
MWIWDLGWKKFRSRIRDGKNSDPVSGINIPDPQHWLKDIVLLFRIVNMQCLECSDFD